MRHTAFVAVLLLLAASPASGQLSDAQLRQRIRTVESEPTAERYLEAAEAARLLRDFDGARDHLEAAWQATGPIINGLIGNTLMLELASGGGAVGAQRAFRDLNHTFHFSPMQVSFWASSFPEILASGEYDVMVLRFDPEAYDPDYRCDCYNTVAWVHRLAGRPDQAAAVWAKLVEQEPVGLDANNADARAQVRGQYARNLARAGREGEARRQLEMSMAIDVSDAALPAVQRRWAQAYAELGEAARAVEYLEPLLAENSLVSVETLESRAAWMLVRDDPAFQAMLDRHR